jgi:hypothetical protein
VRIYCTSRNIVVVAVQNYFYVLYTLMQLSIVAYTTAILRNCGPITENNNSIFLLSITQVSSEEHYVEGFTIATKQK